MSGEKRTYVRVEDRELRRLREQESRLRSVQRDLPERLNDIRRQAQREMMDRLAPIERRQREYESMVSDLQGELGALERDTQKRLRRQHEEFTRGLTEQRGEYLQLFEEQDRKFTGMIEEERRARQQAVANLQGRIDAIVEDAERKKGAAQSFVADLSRIVEETDRLPHGRFAPGQLDDIRRHISDCQATLRSSMPEAALSTAQRAYWDVADLRALVMQKEREFLLLHQAAIQEAREVLEEARTNRKYELEFGQGAERDVVDLEVDFWTRGELTAHEKQIEELETALLDGQGSLAADQVRDILSRLDDLRPKTAEIVEHARRDVLASQLRSNIAEMAADALRDQMFEVQDSAYEGDDERNAYVVKVRNITGSEVVAVISPVEGDFGRNTVSIHSYDETFVDDQTLAQRAREIVSALNEEGLQADAPTCAGSADQDYRDVETVRQRITAKTGK